MKAVKANLLQFLNKSFHLEVPVYHRRYSWSTRQCKQLWNDIIGIINNNCHNHFFGSVVYVEKESSHISGVNKYFLVDGQQRIVSILLLLKVLKETMRATDYSMIYDNYLFNMSESGNSRFKIALNPSDMETFVSIFENREDFSSSPNFEMLENFELFKQLISESQIVPTHIFNCLNKLEIIDIALQQDIDNPQSVYNSLNGYSMQISETDKIKGFLFRNSENSDMYNSYWLSMEKNFSLDAKMFNKFLNDYLIVHQNDEDYDEQMLYENFLEFYQEKSKFQNVREIIKHIYTYSKYFIKLVEADEKDHQIREKIERINLLNLDYSYPFLLQVYDDYESQRINKDIFIEILRNIENYGLRAGSVSQKAAFMSLSKDINKILVMSSEKPVKAQETVQEAVEMNANPFVDTIRKRVSSGNINPVSSPFKRKYVELEKTNDVDHSKSLIPS